MTFRPILYVLGALLCALSGAMIAPMLADAQAGHPDWQVFAASAAASAFPGGALIITNRGEDPVALDLRQAFLLTNVCWFGAAAFAALPFLFSGHGLDYADAFFEAVSGLTTTGSTVLTGLDALPPGLLLWRSILQWIGGIGIVVMAIIILPFLRVGGMQLFHTESSERSGRIVARPGELVTLIGASYFIISALCALAYWLAGMSGFDAINHAMTTVSTGGYSTHDASIGHFESPLLLWIGTVFMLSGSIPFVLYIEMLRGRGFKIWQHSQIRALVLILLGASATLAVWIKAQEGGAFADAFTRAMFNVTSIATTTGYASEDYLLWGSFAIGMFFVLTFVGGCTGSTSGAIKIYRHQVLFILTRNHIRSLFAPHRVSRLTYSGSRLPEDVPTSILAFVALYMTSVVALTLGLMLFGADFETALSGAATAIGNVGPGLGPEIGPAGNFAALPDGGKWLLSAGMLLGRLELFTVLVLFDSELWRR